MIVGEPHVVDGDIVDQDGRKVVAHRPARNSNQCYHLIDPVAWFGDRTIEPQCQQTARNDRPWRMNALEDISPHWSCCDRCSGDYQNSDQGTTGPRLCNKLEEMSPREFDEQAGIGISRATESWEDKQEVDG